MPIIEPVATQVYIDRRKELVDRVKKSIKILNQVLSCLLQILKKNAADSVKMLHFTITLALKNLHACLS